MKAERSVVYLVKLTMPTPMMPSYEWSGIFVEEPSLALVYAALKADGRNGAGEAFLDRLRDAPMANAFDKIAVGRKHFHDGITMEVAPRRYYSWQ